MAYSNISKLCLVLVGALGVFQSATPATAHIAPATLVLPPRSEELQAGLEKVLARAPFRDLVRRGLLSVSLVDLTDPGTVRYAGVDDDHMRYAASLPKIGILLGLFDQIDRGTIPYTPELRHRVERMIRHSNNAESTTLLRLIGFETVAATLEDPRYQLYSRERNGGIWVGRDYGGWIGLWRRDPLHGISHGATTRQVARFFVMLDQDRLVSPWACAEMKRVLGESEIHHKFVLGLERERPGSRIYRKSGTWKNWHADAALVERDGKKYVAVALLESPTGGKVLPKLIVGLDDLIPPAPPLE